jgi:sarcosine oxidase gamma subunit
MRVIVDVTAFTGTSITFTLNLCDPIDSTKVQAVGATAAIAATGVHVITVHPAVVTAAAAAGKTLVGDVAPGKWQLVSSGTITSVTYTVVVEYYN